MKQLKKTLLTLVALLAVTGAWADETPLLTINASSDFVSGSKTFDDKVTVTFSNPVYYDGEEGWYADGTASLLTVAGINGYTITSCKFYTNSGDAQTGYTVEGESPSVYLSASTEVYNDANQSVYLGYQGVKKIEVFGTAPSASSGPEVAWNKAEKTGTFTMPGGNVTLEPEYYPQAALTAAPTAINDVPATTDGAIVNAGTVANIGSTTTAQGTVMYYVSQTALDDAALLALAADKWTADVPTAAHLAQGQAYVYYYVRGNDSNNDAENFSDGDILAANALQVTLGAAPLWNAEFDLTDAPEADKAGKWSTNIPEGGVVKGTEVKVTYTGSKKVIGVKAEKKAKGNIVDLSTLTEAYEAQTLDILTGTTSQLITIAAGATVTLKDATVNNQIACSGTATIILADGSTNTVTVTTSGKAGIQIGGEATTTLTINAETAGTGILNATGGDDAAGIGTSKDETGGNIVINGGTVTATGGNNAAGIGTGNANTSANTCGAITINGGTVTAKGGGGAAGIGTGVAYMSKKNTCDAITINGGTVTATGGYCAAGIGTGLALNATNECGAITIGTGVTKVTATKGSESPNSIGKGNNDGGTQTCGTITIGGTVKDQSEFTGATYTYTPSN